MGKLWNKLFVKNKNLKQQNIVFELKVELSFRTVVQVSYKDEYGNTKIIRFFNDKWTKEVLSLSDKPEDIAFKIFVHSPHLLKDENVKLSLASGGEIILVSDFKISKGKDYAGWFQLV